MSRYAVHTWFERDRSNVWVEDTEHNSTVVEWWDEDCQQMFEDGFFNARDLENSVLSYCADMGLINMEDV